MGSKRQGFILLIALAIIASLASIITAGLSRTVVELLAANQDVGRYQAFHLADAGVEHALIHLKTEPTWAGHAFTVGELAFAIDVDPPPEANEDTAADPLYSDLWLRRVTSSGFRLSNGQPVAGSPPVVVQVIVELEPSPFDGAIGSHERITLNSNAHTDSYDSRLGAYNQWLTATAAFNRSLAGTITVNSTADDAIVLASNAEVEGDVRIGPGGNCATTVEIVGNADYTGTCEPLVYARLIEPAPFPSGTATEALVLDGAALRILPAGTHRYTSVHLNSNALLEANGPVTLIVENDFTMDSNTRFQNALTTPEATITMYVNGSVHLDSNAVLSAANDPTHLALFVTGAGSVTMPGSAGKLFGAIHAPNSVISLDSNAEVYGGVIGRQVHLNSHAWIHYDAALQQQWPGRVHIRCWQQLCGVAREAPRSA